MEPRDSTTSPDSKSLTQILRAVSSRAIDELASWLEQSFPRLGGELVDTAFSWNSLLVRTGLAQNALRVLAEIDGQVPALLRVDDLSYDVRHDDSAEYRRLQFLHALWKFFDAFRRRLEFRLILMVDPELRGLHVPDQLLIREGPLRVAQLIIAIFLSDGERAVENLMEEARNLIEAEAEQSWPRSSPYSRAAKIENELKRAIAADFIASKGCVSMMWSEQVTLACDTLDYFKDAMETGPAKQAVDELTKLLKQVESVEDAYGAMRASAEYYGQRLPEMWGSILGLVDQHNARFRELAELFEKMSDQRLEMDRAFTCVLRWHDDFAIQLDLLRAVVEGSLLRTMGSLPTLRAKDPKVRRVLQYFLQTAKCSLASGAFLPSFGRQRYAMGSREIIDSLIDLLELGQGDRFLDLFANVPFASWAAVLLGARVTSVEMAYAESAYTRYHARFARYGYPYGLASPAVLAMLRSQQVVPPIGGPFMRDTVDPTALELFTQSRFAEFIRENIPTYCEHRYSDQEDIDDRLELPMKFDKILVDPPYGRETAREGFGPSQALSVARKGIRDISNLLEKGGLALLTLPSLRWPGHPWDEWRREALLNCRQHGLTLLNTDLPPGRALALLRKE